ncbi:hypothetical protein BT69DRAFT_866941 [Atractiella rhizophila]|nr:hypothetical protein BT69DRAFT_866941 [Atractiella rhizophila]
MRPSPGTSCVACKKGKRKCIRDSEDLTKSCLNCVSKRRECILQVLKPRAERKPSGTLVSIPKPKPHHEPRNSNVSRADVSLARKTLGLASMLRLLRDGYRQAFSTLFIPSLSKRIDESNLDWIQKCPFGSIIFLTLSVYGARLSDHPELISSVKPPSHDPGDFRAFGRAREGPCRELLSQLMKACFEDEHLKVPSLQAVTIILDVARVLMREFDDVYSTSQARQKRRHASSPSHALPSSTFAAASLASALEMRELLELAKRHLDHYYYGGRPASFLISELPHRPLVDEVCRFAWCDLWISSAISFSPLMSISDWHAFDVYLPWLNPRSYFDIQTFVREPGPTCYEDQESLTFISQVTVQHSITMAMLFFRCWQDNRTRGYFIPSTDWEVKLSKQWSPANVLSSLITEIDLVKAWRRSTHYLIPSSWKVHGLYGEEEPCSTRESVILRARHRFACFALAEETVEMLSDPQREIIEPGDEEELKLMKSVWESLRERAHEDIDAILDGLIELNFDIKETKSLAFYYCVREIILILKELPSGLSYLRRYVDDVPNVRIQGDKFRKVQNLIHLNKSLSWFGESFADNVDVLEDSFASFASTIHNHYTCPLLPPPDTDQIGLKISPRLNFKTKEVAKVRWKADVDTVLDHESLIALLMVQDALSDISSHPTDPLSVGRSSNSSQTCSEPLSVDYSSNSEQI